MADEKLIGHESPVNKTAALVTSKGFQYSPDKKFRDSDMPLQCRQPDDGIKSNPSFSDLTGTKFGRMTVIGMSKDRRKSWVCRCSCGRYCLRTAKAIKNPQNYGDRCDLCQHHAYLIRDRLWKETGKEIDLRDV